MLNIFYSNRIEVLAAQVSSLLKHAPLAVFDTEFILVESAAMSQWLMQRIASNNGIAANIEFPFPAALLWQIYRSQQPDLPKHSSYDRQPLTWRLYDLFKNRHQKQHQQPALDQVFKYIDQLPGDRQLLGFAEYIASLYDQYQIYRPEMLLQWCQSRQEDVHWQASLWRYLHQLIPHEKDRASIFYDSMQLPLTDAHLPNFKRLQVFALSNLPKPYMDIIARVSEWVEVNLFVLNPCAMFWSDIRTRKSQDQPEHDSENNDLLAMMAQQGRDHMRLLQEYSFELEREAFVDQKADSLLQHLQKDLLHLRQKAPGDDKVLLVESDNSIVVHACHSRLREVQIVKNQILQYLEINKTAKLDQIAIMVPDLESYTVYFHSVFNSQNNPLPFHLAERRSLDKTSAKMAILQLCLLKEKRFSRSTVVELLKIPLVARRFSLDDLPLIEQLLHELQVHFGLSDEDWWSLGEGIVSMSWQQAKDRLLQSYCLPTDAYSGLVGGIDEQTANQLGQLCLFTEQLAGLHTLDQARTVADWCQYMDQLLTDFMQPEDDYELAELREIRSLLDNWLEKMALGECTQPLPFDVFYQTLENLLENAPGQHYFRADVINIATLLPMRSLPFSKICLLGMNDGEYPRIEANDPLDIMRQNPAPGDRNRQHEDRYLFLEAILAARDKLHISYIGKSHIDNTERFPSLLVAELLDYLNTGYAMHDAVSLQDKIVIMHALQPFDPRYFTQTTDLLESIQSYDTGFLAQAKALVSDKDPEPCYAARIEHDDDVTDWSLADFIQAITEPQKWYLKRNQIYTDEGINDDEDLELMTSDGLHHYQLLHHLLDEGKDQRPFSDSQRCCQLGLIPQGQSGVIDYEQQLEKAQSLLTLAENFELDAANGYSFIDIETAPGNIQGIIQGVTQDNTRRLAWLGEKIHGKHILSAWIEHILWQIDTAQPLNSYLLGSTETVCFKPVPLSVASKLLDEWTKRANLGHQALVHTFVKSGWQYRLALAEKPERADNVLHEKLFGNSQFPGEWQQAHYQFAYRGIDTLPMQDILDNIDALYTPVFAYMERQPL